MREVFELVLVDDLQEASVEPVAPRVVPATDAFVGKRAAVRRQPGAAVEARVVVRDHSMIARADHENRLLTDRVLDEIPALATSSSRHATCQTRGHRRSISRSRKARDT